MPAASVTSDEIVDRSLTPVFVTASTTRSLEDVSNEFDGITMASDIANNEFFFGPIYNDWVVVAVDNLGIHSIHYITGLFRNMRAKYVLVMNSEQDMIRRHRAYEMLEKLIHLKRIIVRFYFMVSIFLRQLPVDGFQTPLEWVAETDELASRYETIMNEQSEIMMQYEEFDEENPLYVNPVQAAANAIVNDYDSVSGYLACSENSNEI